MLWKTCGMVTTLFSGQAGVVFWGVEGVLVRLALRFFGVRDFVLVLFWVICWDCGGFVLLFVIEGGFGAFRCRRKPLEGGAGGIRGFVFGFCSPSGGSLCWLGVLFRAGGIVRRPCVRLGFVFVVALDLEFVWLGF